MRRPTSSQTTCSRRLAAGGARRSRVRTADPRRVKGKYSFSSACFHGTGATFETECSVGLTVGWSSSFDGEGIGEGRAWTERREDAVDPAIWDPPPREKIGETSTAAWSEAPVRRDMSDEACVAWSFVLGARRWVIRLAAQGRSRERVM